MRQPLDQSLLSALKLAAAGTLGHSVATQIGVAAKSGRIDVATQLIAHAALGCATEGYSVRYLQRCHSPDEVAPAGIRNASEVRSLRSFQPDADVLDGEALPPSETLAFLKRYLRLTHCDLFFADAAVLVEGAAEKLLLPSMIEKSAGRLRSTYLTILEVGGAYAHRFEGLLSFLHIPYLVITDLDSVAHTGYPTTCRADVEGARTSNASLKKLCGRNTVAELMAMQQADRRPASLSASLCCRSCGISSMSIGKPNFQLLSIIFVAGPVIALESAR